MKRLKLVAIVGAVEIGRMGLTYDGSGISAMLDDVWLDVRKSVRKGLSTSFYERVILSTVDGGRKLKVSNIPRIRLIRALS